MPALPLTPEQLADKARLRAYYENWKATQKTLGLPNSQAALAALLTPYLGKIDKNGERLEISQSAINQYIKGKGEFNEKTGNHTRDGIPLNEDVLIAFCKIFECDYSDISPAIAKLIDRKAINAGYVSADPNQAKVQTQTFVNDDVKTQVIPEGYITLDYYDIQSSAGFGKYAEENPVLRQLLVLEDWAISNFGKNADKNIKPIRNKGDSMSPTIQDGDILFVDITEREFTSEGIYILDWHGRLLTKRLIVSGEKLVVSSDNSSTYKSFEVGAADIEGLTICGRVLKWWNLRGY